METKLVKKIIGELNSELLAGLDPEPNHSRSSNKPNMHCALRDGAVDSIIIVGGSNAGKLAAAAKNLGLDVFSETIPGWRISKESVQNTAGSLKDKISSAQPGTPIVIMALDNSAFCGVTSNGNISIMTKSNNNDSKYHAEGDLIVTPERSMIQVIDQLNLLIENCGENPVFVLSPLPRYVVGKCCQDPSHMTNFTDNDYLKAMLEELGKLRGLLLRRVKGAKVVNSLELIAGGKVPPEKAETVIRSSWNTDPVHPNPRSFAKMALHLLDVLAEPVQAAGTSSSRKRTWSQSEVESHGKDKSTNRSQRWKEANRRGGGGKWRGGQAAGMAGLDSRQERYPGEQGGQYGGYAKRGSGGYQGWRGSRGAEHGGGGGRGDGRGRGSRRPPYHHQYYY